MKKIFAIMTMALMLFACTSCKEKVNFLVWNVEVTGNADGAVEVTFPYGGLSFSDGANFDFHYGNDGAVPTELVFGDAVSEVVTFGEALQSENEEVKDAAELFSATALNGTYEVRFNGYVYVPLTNIRIQIDTTFTNRVPPEVAQ